MIQFFKKRGLPGAALLSGAALLVALLSGSAFAAVPEHADITLKDDSGALITDLTSGQAYSVQETCFTADCHGSGTGVMAYDYNDIERHSYHAQLAANDQYGWAAWNPDGDKWESGPGPKGKNWVQGQGHVGAW